MTAGISTGTQAILLLTARLTTGRDIPPNDDLLTPGEFRQFAAHLQALGYGPADLLGNASRELLPNLRIAEDRLNRLLDRGFLLSQAIERWHSRSIWVLSVADSEYPRNIRTRLKDSSPAILYGCGQQPLLEEGGLAVVGSRHADQTLVDYAEQVGRQCAEAAKTIISGGAQGIDRAAMRGALEAGGKTIAILSDSLEQAALNRSNRDCLLDRQLALISPYDPGAGFNIGNAMQRNKLIYALADAALVVSSDYEKGGTWAGATEQLQKFRFVPVYVRSTGETGPGLQALTAMGARPWPAPQTREQLLSVLAAGEQNPPGQQAQLPFPESGA